MADPLISLDHRTRSARWRLRTGAVLGLVLALAAIAPAAADPPLSVLLISSWFKDMSWHQAFESGLRAGFEAEGREVILFVEFLDSGRFLEERQHQINQSYLREKYRGHKIDLIIAESLSAVRFVRANRDTLPSARRIYVQTGTIGEETGDGQTLVVPVDYGRTVAEMVRLIAPRRIYVVGDGDDPVGAARVAALRAALTAEAGMVETLFLVDRPLGEIRRELAALPPQSAVFYLPIRRDDRGAPLTPKDGAALIAAAADAPVFSIWQSMMGSGLLGGYMQSAERIGRMAARAAIDPQQAPDTTAPLDADGYFFDWREMVRWGIEEKALPPGAEVMFRDGTLFDQFRWQILSIGGVLVALLVISLFLGLVSRHRARRSKALAASVRQLEERVVERTAVIQAANRELDAFAYAVSHDLRAPLRAMTGFAQALEEDFGSSLDGEARAYLHEINAASAHMTALIDGILRLSRSSRGALQCREVDLSELSDQVIRELREVEPAREVQCEIQPGLKVWGDAAMLGSVMQNLIGNAWKYSARTAQATIQVSGVTEGGWHLIRVADNGAGFDMRYAAKLFEPFQRLYRQEEFPGIGIGLATVQRIIRRHGGEVTAEAAVGEGATFCFTLPIRGNERVWNSVFHVGEIDAARSGRG